MFFDDNPEFLETSTTAADRDRLNLRHLAIIDAHRDLLNGARVLDIASHDGRWSYAALDAGAAHVIGVEGRPELVENAKRTIAAKGIDESRFSFIAGDAHDVLTQGVGQVDVAMCLGFMYHTLRYPELMAGIRATGAKHVIVDSMVLPNNPRPVVRITGEGTQGQALAVEDRFSHKGRSLIGIPSEEAIVTMLRVFGYKVVDRTDWQALIRKFPKVKTVKSYAEGKRVTLVAVDAD